MRNAALLPSIQAGGKDENGEVKDGKWEGEGEGETGTRRAVSGASGSVRDASVGRTQGEAQAPPFVQAGGYQHHQEVNVVMQG